MAARPGLVCYRTTGAGLQGWNHSAPTVRSGQTWIGPPPLWWGADRVCRRAQFAPKLALSVASSSFIWLGS